MELFTKNQIEQLYKNGANRDKDHPPVSRLFMTNTKCVWLISELYADQPGYAFGLCDLGFGFPELGYCDLSEIKEAENTSLGLKLFPDNTFVGNFPMSTYQAAAREHRRIIWDDAVLRQYTIKPHV